MDEKIINSLLWTIYGDALGFLMANTDVEIDGLKDFIYIYDNNLEIKKSRGQYSYITELILINIKSLIDSAHKYEVKIDYNRFFEELKLWFYYRHGRPENLFQKLSDRNYYRDDFYWEDVQGSAMARIFPLAMANKNYNSLEREVYKNIIYLNRHPRVILSGLLLSRTIYSVLEKKIIEKEEIIKELKEYIIHLQFDELNQDISMELPNNYRVEFEKEKINYLMDIDKLTRDQEIKDMDGDAGAIFLYGLDIFFKLGNMEELLLKRLNKKESNEVLAIGYGLWGMVNERRFDDYDLIKDMEFIKDMGRYLYRLRNFRVNRKAHKRKEEGIKLFHLNKGDLGNHGLLGPIQVLDKIETNTYIQMSLRTRSGTYNFIQNKKRQ